MSVKSYFAPEVVKTFTSNFNDKVQLVTFSGQLRLDMGDLTQSGQVIEKIWARAFKKLLPSNFNPKKILVLGFGAGSVAKVIEKKWPKAKITGVEIDPVVIKIAQEHFGANEIQNLKIINQDAEKFVMTTREKFDLILVDCYQGYKIPPVFEDIGLLNKLLKLLSDNTKTVLVNRLFWDSHQKKTLKFLEGLNKSFITTTCRTPSNLIIKYNESDVPKAKKSL